MAVASAGLYASLHPIPDNHANIPPLSFLQAGCPSLRPTNSVKALKALVEAKPEVEIPVWRRAKKINFLTLVSYSLLQTVFNEDVPFCHNTKRHRQTDRQTDKCAKGSTYSTVGQKPRVSPVWRQTPLFYVTILATLCIKELRLIHITPTELN